ncbi:MAG: dihydroneopterin triphosphate diphosphatase [Pseudoalteromonas spongiae]|uniref:dihydroneopterin triphosphate diphosphatase n=1 Tax=Pseudoalteromonas sp. T1lg24 TaxID=2077099 RepID=UPI000CF71C78|nr:dihydroneopterin triphosphate diphosphatase [Pseudoalteromonas sp. T1lg24]
MLRDPYSVLVVIQNTKNQFLVMQRADDPSFWQSVTGGIEQNETALACAYREVLEETGINCHKQDLTIKDLNITNRYEIRPQWRSRYKPNCTINTEFVFHLLVPVTQSIVLHPNEHLAYKWLNYQDTLEILWSDSNKQAITSCYEQTMCKLI